MLQNLSSNASSIVSKSIEGPTSQEFSESTVSQYSAVADAMSDTRKKVRNSTELSASEISSDGRSGDDLPLAVEPLAEDDDVPSDDNLLLKLMANSAGNHQNLTDEQAAQLQQLEPLSDQSGDKTNKGLLSSTLLYFGSDPRGTESFVARGEALIESEYSDGDEGVASSPKASGETLMPVTAMTSLSRIQSSQLANNTITGVGLSRGIETAGNIASNVAATDMSLIDPILLSFTVSDQVVTDIDLPLNPLVGGIQLNENALLTGETVELSQQINQETDAVLLSSELDSKHVIDATAQHSEMGGQSRSHKNAGASDIDNKTIDLFASSEEDGEFSLTEEGSIQTVVNATDKAMKQPLTDDLNQRVNSEVKLTQTAVENLEIDASLDDRDSVADKFNRPTVEQTQTVFQRAAVKPSAELQLVAQQDLLDRPMKMAEAANSLSDKIHTMIRGELKHAVIRLDPPELGALEVRIQVQHEQTQVQIVSQSAQVREALEQQSARLREALGEQGLTMANLDVSDQSNQQASDGDQSSGLGGADEDGESSESVEVLEVKATIGLVDQYV